MTGTAGGPERFGGMAGPEAIWLVCNAASGSNNARAVEQLEHALTEGGLPIEGRTAFPDEPLPETAELDRRGIGLVVVYAGDGTINSAIERLGGWHGAMLVLPGGTMNLLARRLHGDRPTMEIVGDIAAGRGRRCRPDVIECPHGRALAGLMAGPGTSWCEVREAMREGDVAAIAAGAVKALEDSLGGAGIACRDPALGRREGYPLLMFTPEPGGMTVEAYHAESAGEYVAQGWALLKRNFREGPHDELGSVRRIVIASSDGAEFGLLIDGEARKSGPQVELVLASCAIDLLATVPDGR